MSFLHLAFALVLGPPDLPDALEEQIARAMETNPEVQIARANVQEAEAAFRQVRLRISQDVMRVHNLLTTQKLMIRQAALQLERVQALAAEERVSDAELQHAETYLIQEKQTLSQLQAELHYLLGYEGKTVTMTTSRGAEAYFSATGTGSRRPSVPENLADCLDTRLGPMVCENANLRQVVEQLNEEIARQKIPLSMVLNESALMDELGDPEDIQFDLRLQSSTSLREVLTAVADLTGVCFVIRNYGILVTAPYQAAGLYAPTIPPHVTLDPAAVPPGADREGAR